MIYKWNLINESYARDLLYQYITGSEVFSGKTIELYRFGNAEREISESRTYVNKSLDKSKYPISMEESLLKEHLLRDFPGNVLEIREKMEELEDIVDTRFVFLDSSRTLSGEEKECLDEILRKFDLFGDSTSLMIRKLFGDGSPVIRFLPVLASGKYAEIFERVWDHVLAGENRMIRKKYWTYKDKDGNPTNRKSESVDGEKYFKIRSIDDEDFEGIVDNIMDGGKFSD